MMKKAKKLVMISILLLPLALSLTNQTNKSKYIYVENPPYVCSEELSIVNLIFENKTAKEILQKHPEYTMVIFVNPFIFNGATEVKGYPLVKAYLGIYNPKTKKCENYTERTLIAINDKGQIVIGDKEFSKYNIDAFKVLDKIAKNIKYNLGDLLNLLMKLNLPYDWIERILNLFSFLALPILIVYYFLITMVRLLFYKEKTIKKGKIKVKKNKWGIILYRLTKNYDYLWNYVSFPRFLIEIIKIKLLRRNYINS